MKIFDGQPCVPKNEKLTNDVIHGVHHSKYILHPVMTKIYQDIKRMYWWPGMKMDVVDFIAKCLTYFEHQRSGGPLQLLKFQAGKRRI